MKVFLRNCEGGFVSSSSSRSTISGGIFSSCPESEAGFVCSSVDVTIDGFINVADTDVVVLAIDFPCRRFLCLYMLDLVVNFFSHILQVNNILKNTSNPSRYAVLHIFCDSAYDICDFSFDFKFQ